MPERRAGCTGLHLWWGLCAALALPSLALHLALYLTTSSGNVPLDHAVASWPPLAQALVMQPEAGLTQPPWVWWTTAWLHGSNPHLLRNLAGALLLAALGWGMPPPRHAAAAWLMAWPLTQVGMVFEATLTSYVGLSGVLHAGLVVLALSAMARKSPRPIRLCAIGLLVGTMCKLLMENPGGHSLMASSASAINVAPWAHLSGCVAGALSIWAIIGFIWTARHVMEPQRDMI